MTTGPDVQVGPLGWALFWAIVILAALGLVFGPTFWGAVIFVIAGAVILLVVYFIFRRMIGRASGRRA